MDDLSLQHIRKSKQHTLLILLISLATFLFAIYSMGTGSSSNLGFWTTVKIILGLDEGTELQSAIIWKLRFPRVLMAIVGGAAAPKQQSHGQCVRSRLDAVGIYKLPIQALLSH